VSTRASHKCGSSTGWPQVPAKSTCRLCTRGSGSYYSHGSWQIQVKILDFRRYLQVPAGYPLPAHAQYCYHLVYKFYSFLYIFKPYPTCPENLMSKFSIKSCDIVKSCKQALLIVCISSYPWIPVSWQMITCATGT
jgi:hypothetical protein